MYVQPTAPSDCAHHMRKHQDTHLIDMQIVPCSKLCDSVSPANCTNQLLLSDTGQKPGASHHRHGEYSAFNAVQFRSRNCFMVNVAQIRRRKTDHSLKLFQVIQEEKAELTAPCPLNSLFSLILGRNQNGCQEFEAALHHANQICAGQFMKVSYHLSYLSQVSVRRFPSLGMYVRLIVC